MEGGHARLAMCMQRWAAGRELVHPRVRVSWSWCVQVCAGTEGDEAGADAIRALVQPPLKAEQQASALSMELVVASREGDVAEVRRLAAAGADVNVGEGTAVLTPLTSAAEAGHVEVVRELVARGARVDGTNVLRWTPLMFAAQRGHARVVDALVALRSRVDGVDALGNTALHWAAHACYPTAVRSLVVAGARLDVRNIAGKTAADEVSDRASRHHWACGSHALCSPPPPPPPCVLARADLRARR
jgi:ankyrin repeat protein